MKNILFFGDSLTAGYGLANPSKDSFPALIEKKIRAACFGYKVINAGLSGETSQGGLNRISIVLNEPVDIFVLGLGANDLLRGINPVQTTQNLQSIIDQVKLKNPAVHLVLLGMEFPDIFPFPQLNAFRNVFRDLATKNKMDFLPFLLKDVAGIPRLNLADGLHPTAEGYKIIAENVWKLMEPFL
nr:arylesterase [uncultured Pedobacter sp.]